MIKFLTKVAFVKACSTLPGGHSLYRWAQQNITKSTIPTDEMIRSQAANARKYFNLLRNIENFDTLKKGVHVEIGAGWYLTIPMMFWQYGWASQCLTDVRRHANWGNISEVARFLRRFSSDEFVRRRLPIPLESEMNEYLDRLSISYRAPQGSLSPFADGYASLVTASSVLRYPSRSDARKIIEEVSRVLRVGGIFIANIYLLDEFCFVDRDISTFNFLRYTDKQWGRWFDCGFASANRMRASDFAHIIDGLPFVVEKWEATKPGPAEYKELAKIEISKEFLQYDREDLATSELTFMLRRI